ncbi:hypothetical protein A2U01_0093323, partial [Trifolium medium]|nr:hypothetical protein [Trifolium medium]
NPAISAVKSALCSMKTQKRAIPAGAAVTRSAPPLSRLEQPLSLTAMLPAFSSRHAAAPPL